jgi:glycine C-acetyltransferase
MEELADESAETVDSEAINFHDFHRPRHHPDLWHKTREFYSFLLDAKARGHYAYRRTLLEGSTARTLVVDPRTGEPRRMILMASNNYLDLCTDPRVISAARSALEQYGCGSGSVSLLAGTQDIHRRLEARLAAFYGREAAAVFPTGYSVNVGTISALLGPGDLALVDLYAHASLIDGTKLAGCLTKFFKHQDLDHLARLLTRLRQSYHGVLIITDGVFSMDGDVCRLRELIELKEAYGARLLVDEAHAVGVLGEHGKGTEEYAGVLGQTDLITGTLSKAPGGLGGYVVGSAEVVEYVRHFAGSYVFSTSLPAPVVGGLLAAFDLLEHDHARRARLGDNAAYFARRLREAGCVVENTVTPIVPVIIGDELITRKIALDLHDQGIFAAPVTFPAVPKLRSRIRFSVMSSHTREELDYVVDVMQSLLGRHRVSIRAGAPP